MSDIRQRLVEIIRSPEMHNWRRGDDPVSWTFNNIRDSEYFRSQRAHLGRLYRSAAHDAIWRAAYNTIGFATAPIAAATSFASRWFQPKVYEQSKLKRLRIEDELVPDSSGLNTPAPAPISDFLPTPSYNPYAYDSKNAIFASLAARNHPANLVTEPEHYVNRLPSSQNVTLVTRFPRFHTYLSDRGTYRRNTYWVHPSLLKDAWAAFGSSIYSPIPTWSKDADFWNTLYSKHHVYGYSLRAHFYSCGTPPSTLWCAAYATDGFNNDGVEPTVADMTDIQSFASQPYGCSHCTFNPLSATTHESWDFSWDFSDCAKAFGRSVADDNRLDETSTGSRVVPADAKNYTVYFTVLDIGHTDSFWPDVEFELVQHVTFYDRITTKDA